MTNSSQSLKERIRRNRVFILGAGFSAGAGVPLTQTLLEEAMAMFKQECPGLYERVNNYAREMVGPECEEVNYGDINFTFSNFCTFLDYIELREHGGGERWSNAGSRERLALRFYLAKTISKFTPASEDVPELYLRFAEQLHEGDIILSFNWDCLLELALERIGKKFTYNFEDNAIKLCKLHGSINWRLGPLDNLAVKGGTLQWQGFGYDKGMMDVDVFHTPHLIHHAAWSGFEPLGELQPFLVLPGYGKAFEARLIAPLWYKPEFAFAYTHDVYIIGMSLALDDFFIRSYFMSNLPYISSETGSVEKIIYIINPADEITETYKFVLDTGKAVHIKERFDVRHINLMNERLTAVQS